MGIGVDFNEDLMERMAIKGGGHFYFIEDARQIPDFLHRELVKCCPRRRVMSRLLSTCRRHRCQIAQHIRDGPVGAELKVRLTT